MTASRAPKRLGRLIAAEAISTFGSQLAWFALPWFVLTTTGSPTRMGLVMAAETAPIALLSAPGAELASRWGARRTLLASDGLRVPLMALIPLLYGFGMLSFGLLLALVFTLGCFIAPYLACQRVLLGELVENDQGALERVNALFSAATRVPFLVAPAVAGVLVALVGAMPVIAANSVTFALSFALIASAVPRVSTTAARPPQRLLEGVRWLRTDRVLRGVTTSNATAELAFQALLASLPVLVVVRYGAEPATAGALMTCWGAGALLGTLAAYLTAARFRPLHRATLATVIQACALWPLAVDMRLEAAGALVAIVGVCAGLRAPAMTTLITLRTPVELRTQVLSASIAITMLSGPAGLLVAGPALETYGVAVVFTAAASLCTASALILLILASQAPDPAAPNRPGRGDRRRSSTRLFWLPSPAFRSQTKGGEAVRVMHTASARIPD